MEKEYAINKSVRGHEIKNLRKKMNITRKDFALLTGVSVKTVEYWEGGDKEITGPIVLICRILWENMLVAEQYEFPVQEYPLRFVYMYKDMPCTVIDVDEVNQLIRIKNFTSHLNYRAFGIVENPDYNQFMEFVKSRCFPETRDKMKLELERIGLPFYDPIAIVEKTEGRMADDQFSIKIIRRGSAA